jgi:hypothetical protein
MSSLWIILRLVVGGTLVTAGLVGLVIPLIPGIPLLIIGLSLSLTWHPRGLRVWRRMKVAVLRRWQRLRRRATVKP